MSLSARPVARRRGTTLVELVVALMAFGLVAAVGVRALQLTSRWYERFSLFVERRAQLDAARHLLVTLPVAASPADSDLAITTDSTLTWSATVASAVICEGAGTSAVVPRTPLHSGVDLSAWATAPQVGDTLLVLDDGPSVSPVDDRWRRHGVTGVHAATGGCVGGPLADSVTDAAAPAWQLDLATPLGAGDVGAPARLVRWQRLALYRASTGEGQLGFADVGASGWSVIQPVAGPLVPPGAAAPGLDLRWLDSLLAPAGRGATLVRGTIRAPTRRPLRRAGAPPAGSVDSLGIIIALRNRR